MLALAMAATAGIHQQQATVAAQPIPTATEVQDGLVVPWDVDFAPDGRMFVTERPGRIRVYASGEPDAALLGTVTIPNVRAEHESGANGLAVDVAFATHPYLYVCAARDTDGPDGSAPWVNEVLRYEVRSGATLAAPQVILTGAVANTQHNGCAVEMDASGHLWIGIGDGAVADRAQDPTSLNGKILRIHRNGAVPADNPVMPGARTRGPVYSMGHRNPQGIGFAPGGSVYAVEHGPSINDEMNLITAGGNYGWPCYTGAATPNTTPAPPDDCGAAREYLAPVWSSGSPTIATSGMTFLDHPTWGTWEGTPVVAQLKDQDLRRFTVGAGGAMVEVNRFLDGTHGRLRAAVMAPDGALYVTTSNGTDDRILRIVPGDVQIDRISGDDRYATAAQLSAATFSPGVPTVYVATAANYPDALAGGAAAARDRGPVLLVSQRSLPSDTATELARLRPNRIVVLGGEGAISAAVEAQLRSYAGGGGTVRLAGIDRYATAAAISRSTFAPNVPVVYIATGQNYPDALAGVPAAGRHGGPILLVTTTGVPRQTMAELERLQPQRIVVLGGPDVIRTTVVNTLQQFTRSAVERRAGADRYGTAVSISTATFGPNVDRVFIATGTNFPDGLAGGPAAALRAAPLLLVPATSVPAAVRDELLRLDPDRVTILGGPTVVSDAVVAEIDALLNP